MIRNYNEELENYLNEYDVIDLEILYKDDERISIKFTAIPKSMREECFNEEQKEEIESIARNIISAIFDYEFKKINERLAKIEQRLDALEQNANQLNENNKAIESYPTVQKRILKN